jgi:hypothetical protein
MLGANSIAMATACGLACNPAPSPGCRQEVKECRPRLARLLLMWGADDRYQYVDEAARNKPADDWVS